MESGLSQVIILTTAFESMGGTQRWANRMANEFDSRGLRVSLVGLNASPNPYPYGLAQSVETTHCFEGGSRAARWNGGIVRRTLAKVRDRIAPDWRPRALNAAAVERLDAVLRARDTASAVLCADHVIMEYLMATPSFLEGRTPPIVVIDQSTFTRAESSRILRQRMVRSYSAADMLVVLTDADAAYFRSLGINTVDVISNPTPPVRPESGAERPAVAVTMGRLEKEKAPQWAISAWHGVLENHPDWTLRVHGEGSMRAELEAQIDKLGLRHAVTLAGRSESPADDLANASIHLLTSQFEGIPLVIGEASAVGTPTIAFACSDGVVSQIRDGETGLLVAPNDLEGLIAAIERLIEDPALRADMGDAARASVKANSIETIADQWLAILRDLAEGATE